MSNAAIDYTPALRMSLEDVRRRRREEAEAASRQLETMATFARDPVVRLALHLATIELETIANVAEGAGR